VHYSSQCVERLYETPSNAGEPPRHEADHGSIYQRFAARTQPLVIFAHPPVVVDPRKRPLQLPPTWQDGELARVRMGCPKRLSRLLMALSVALTWLSLMGLPESGLLLEGFRAAVSAWGRVSVTGMALSLLEKLGNLPLCCLLRISTDG